jgi:hypothetical protein
MQFQCDFVRFQFAQQVVLGNGGTVLLVPFGQHRFEYRFTDFRDFYFHGMFLCRQI